MPAKPARLVSLDALRGFDMFWILGGDAAMRALGKIMPVVPVTTVAGQFEHKAWEGFAFYDLIFPLFVFIVGVSSVFSLTRLVEQHGRATAVKRVLLRTALIFGLGIIYSGGFTQPWPGLRLLGVLQRIALAYGATGLLLCFFKPRALAGITAAILVSYWALLTFVPVRDFQLDKAAITAKLGTDKATRAQVEQAFEATTARVTGHFEPGFNLTNHLDFQYLPGRLYDTYYDPEGLLSTIPAVATCLLGVFAGLLLRRTDRTDAQKLAWLVGGGLAAIAVGWIWGLQFPVIKKLWTSSYVLVAGGWSLLLLALFYYIVDVRQARSWCRPFIWVGLNPITLYLISGMVGYRTVANRFVGGDVKAFFDRLGTGGGDLLAALAAIGVMLALAWFLNKRQIYLRA
ncbi:acyltransferase family protein [Horticoccus sp. 23ND18S-11]|uniref:acyltransferase family protein n=1 Tax=Horticoccus sp. 23ND18S-11 TaxID=3391832 RepID=UPI0039C9B5A3